MAPAFHWGADSRSGPASAARWGRGIEVAEGVAFTLLLYWMDFMGDYWDTLRYARKASPFFYFDPGRASFGTGLSWTEVTVLGSIAVSASPLAFYNFQTQDL